MEPTNIVQLYNYNQRQIYIWNKCKILILDLSDWKVSIFVKDRRKYWNFVQNTTLYGDAYWQVSADIQKF